MNDTKLVLNRDQNLHVYVPYSPNQFLGWVFFAASYSKTALRILMAISYFKGTSDGGPPYHTNIMLIVLKAIEYATNSHNTYTYLGMP